LTFERVFVALGSNLGDRQALLDEAARRVARLPETRVISVAPVIQTAALLPPGSTIGQPDYLNTVAELRTGFEPGPLLVALKGIERAMGRTVTTRWAPRLIDLDLILFGDRVLESAELQVPHPGLASRRFVLEPLVALAPNLFHPVLKVPLAQLLAALPA